MEPVNLPAGYLLPEGKDMHDVLRLDAELFASEGLEPRGPDSGSTDDGAKADTG
jgi:hypothetical protein